MGRLAHGRAVRGHMAAARRYERMLEPTHWLPAPPDVWWSRAQYHVLGWGGAGANGCLKLPFADDALPRIRAGPDAVLRLALCLGCRRPEQPVPQVIARPAAKRAPAQRDVPLPG
jgi:hypothetical protein